MGQMVNGLLYGCKAPDVPPPDGWVEGDDSPAYQLVQRWEKANRVSWSTVGPRIHCESEGGKELLGVWVAVGGSGEDGAEYFLDTAISLDAVPDVFAGAIKRAAKLWGRFAAWCQTKEGIVLPAPQLWLTPCETA